ncbi:MAG: hypothetical protein A3F80_01065 [Candidatus Melainabacteria bacterium RIFCSPLOWO2_12_FULL_35_11]|nr:MAG: hypothetical protein A3F80_01065 [Candidatus Melainabacteria bacterium RIFCSPLOWO2_12_FULL_35_11]
MDKTNNAYLTYFTLKEEARHFINELSKLTNIEFQDINDKLFLESKELPVDVPYIKIKINDLNKVIQLYTLMEQYSKQARNIKVEFFTNN